MFQPKITIWLLPIITLLIVFIGSLLWFFPFKIPFYDAISAIFYSTKEQTIAEITVKNLRLPRALSGAIIGASLSLSGCLLQGITRNPLVSPTIMGINSGATLGIVIASSSIYTQISYFNNTAVAAIGGGLSWLLVMLLSANWRNSLDKSRMVLAGLAVSMFCMGIGKMILILTEDHAYGIIYWLAGGIGNIRWDGFINLIIFCLPSIIISILISQKLNLLMLSDDVALSLGINLFSLRLITNFIALSMVGACVSVAGPISFIGLIGPHIARMIVGVDYRKVVPMSLLVGAILLLMADILARKITFPNEIPAGAILALIGSPFFVWIARGK